MCIRKAADKIVNKAVDHLVSIAVIGLCLILMWYFGLFGIIFSSYKPIPTRESFTVSATNQQQYEEWITSLFEREDIKVLSIFSGCGFVEVCYKEKKTNPFDILP